jgi:hypothetical protein
VRSRSKQHQLKLPIPNADAAGGGRLTEWPPRPRAFPQVYPQDIHRISTGESDDPPEEIGELSPQSTGPTSVDHLGTP